MEIAHFYILPGTMRYSNFKNPVFPKFRHSPAILIFIFALKIIAGFAYAWFYKLPQNFETADTWRFFQLSLAETRWLLDDPIAFTRDLFIYGYDKPGNLFSGSIRTGMM